MNINSKYLLYNTKHYIGEKIAYYDVIWPRYLSRKEVLTSGGKHAKLFVIIWQTAIREQQQTVL